MDEYLIQGETLTGIADQVRRISGVDGELTPEQMTTNLLNVTPFGEYPKAEEAEFGAENASEEYGIQAATQYSYLPSKYVFGWKFKAKEAISILGLRFWDNFGGGYQYTMKLWNSAGEAVAGVQFAAEATRTWSQIEYFDTPVNIAIGETYTVSIHLTSIWESIAGSYGAKSEMTFNSKITFVESVKNTVKLDTGFPGATYSSTYVPLVDIIIGEVAAELPNDYQIARTTMDDIAEEVQRITGTTEKMTTAQIITALQGVAVQSSE